MDHVESIKWLEIIIIGAKKKDLHSLKILNDERAITVVRNSAFFGTKLIFLSERKTKIKIPQDQIPNHHKQKYDDMIRMYQL